MVGPGDEIVPGTGGGREQVIAALKAAFVQGRLSKEEFDLRVGQALAIYAELDALTADVPAAAPAVASQDEVARQAANKKMIQQGTAGIAGLTFLLVAVLVIPRSPVFGVIAGVVLTAFVAVLGAGLLTLLSWALDRRSGAQGAGPAQRSTPGVGGDTGIAGQRGRQPGLGQDPPGTVQAAGRRPHRLATSPT